MTLVLSTTSKTDSSSSSRGSSSRGIRGSSSSSLILSFRNPYYCGGRHGSSSRGSRNATY